MDTYEIECIRMIASTGSIAKAADNLMISRPALSALLNRVEKELNATLFRRTTRGVAMTEKGREYLMTTAEIQKMYDDLKNRDDGDTGIQSFSVGSIDILFRFIFANMLKEYNELVPNVKIIIDDGAGYKAEDKLRVRELDFIIDYLPTNNPDFRYDTLYYEPLILVAPKGHHIGKYAETDPKDGKRYIDISHLQGEKTVLTKKYHRHRVMIDNVFRDKDITLDVVEELSRYGTIFGYAMALGYITIAPYTSVRYSLDKNLMDCFYVKGCEKMFPLAVITNRNSELRDYVVQFIDMLKERIASFYVDISNQ